MLVTRARLGEYADLLVRSCLLSSFGGLLYTSSFKGFIGVPLKGPIRVIRVLYYRGHMGVRGNVPNLMPFFDLHSSVSAS